MTLNVKLVSYNMHGFYQRFSVVDELIYTCLINIFLIFSRSIVHVQTYRSRRGRPFGGVVTLTLTLLKRCIVMSVFPLSKLLTFIVIVYLPCQGTPDRIILCDDLLAQISSWCDRYSGSDLIIAGDFNCCLDSNSDPVSHLLNNFISHYNIMLQRCDRLFPSRTPATYINEALNQQSYIDYMLVTFQKCA